jgi:hypothetical protein
LSFGHFDFSGRPKVNFTARFRHWVSLPTKSNSTCVVPPLKLESIDLDKHEL